MTSWWGAVPAAVAVHPCRGQQHRIEWREGTLRVPAHEDAEAERTLAALGGAAPACIRLRQAWTSWAHDAALVTLGRRPAEEGLGFARPDATPSAGALHVPPLRRRPEVRARRDDFVLLLSLPPAFIDRLVLTAMAAAAEQWSDAAFRERHGLRLGASLASRARPALQRSVAALTLPGEDVVVHCSPSAAGGPLALRAERSAHGLEVTGALPLEWLASVWGAGLSEADGRLVVAVREAVPEGYGVDVVEWVESGRGCWDGVTRPAALERAADAWRVRLDGS